jgi:hypothetical protein
LPLDAISLGEFFGNEEFEAGPDLFRIVRLLRLGVVGFDFAGEIIDEILASFSSLLHEFRSKLRSERHQSYNRSASAGSFTILNFELGAHSHTGTVNQDESGSLFLDLVRSFLAVGLGRARQGGTLGDRRQLLQFRERLRVFLVIALKLFDVFVQLRIREACELGLGYHTEHCEEDCHLPASCSAG